MQPNLITLLLNIWYIIIGIIVFASVWFIEEIIGLIIKKRFKKSKKLPRDAINGVLLFIRFIAAIIILFGLLSYFGIIDPSTTLSFSTIFSTAIGFACAIAIGNMIAGLYIMITRPYHIGDYIQIVGIEGFVTEIGLNFTKIKDATTNIIYRIPNKVAMNENIIIYKTPKAKHLKKGEKQEEKAILDEIQDAIELFKDKMIVKYVLKTEFELELNPKDLKRILEDICERWKPKFGYKPVPLYDFVHWRLSLRIIIISDKMETIQSSLSDYLDDIWLSVYKKVPEVS